MKTSEFIKRVDEIGYYMLWTDRWIDISLKNNSNVVTIFRDSNKIVLNTCNLQLIKLCIEYTETPIEEREEQKKYHVILPDGERKSRFDIVPALKQYEGGIVIVLEERHKVLAKRWFHHTEAEIKKNHEYLWQFAKEVQDET